MRLEPDELLQHTDWMTSLARGLVLDEGAADDVVQQVFVEVMEHAPERPRSPVAWLKSVVRNLARKDHRSARRRLRREVAVARPERWKPADVVERAEIHRLVVDRVLALPEPYREAVLLRYFESLSAEEVARRQRVPAATARSRLQRGLDRLRRDLDSVHGGDGARWLPAVAALAGLEAASLAVPGTAAAAGMPSGAAGASAAAGTAAHFNLQALTLGGTIMSLKTTLTVAVCSVATLLLGGAIGHYTARTGPEEAKARFQLVEASRLAELHSQLATVQAELQAAQAGREELQGEKDRLAARLEGLDGELKAEREKAQTAAETELPKLPVAFGSFADLEGLANTDWPEVGGAVKEMNKLFLDLLADLKAGKPVSPELQKKIKAENDKLVKLALGVMGKIPTHAAVNGEFSHPLVLSNMLSAALDESGLPLTQAQRDAVARLGGTYDAAYEKLQQGYTAETPDLEKVVDELALKQECVQKIRGALSQEQLDAAVPPQLRNLMQLDVMSPGVSTLLSFQPASYESAEIARSSFQTDLLKQLGIDGQAGGSFDEPFSAWQREVEQLLATRREKDRPPVLDQVLIAARAEANLLKRLLAVPELDDKARAAILAYRTWSMPQISAKKE